MKTKTIEELTELTGMFTMLLDKAEKEEERQRAKVEKNLMALRVMGIRNRLTALLGYLYVLKSDIVSFEEIQTEVLELIKNSRKEFSAMLRNKNHAGSHRHFRKLLLELS